MARPFTRTKEHRPIRKKTRVTTKGKIPPDVLGSGRQSNKKPKSSTKIRKELTKKVGTHFVDSLTPNSNEKEMLIGFIKIQSLPKSRKVGETLTSHISL